MLIQMWKYTHSDIKFVRQFDAYGGWENMSFDSLTVDDEDEGLCLKLGWNWTGDENDPALDVEPTIGPSIKLQRIPITPFM